MENFYTAMRDLLGLIIGLSVGMSILVYTLINC